MSEKWTIEPGQTTQLSLDQLSSFTLQTGGGTVTVIAHDGPGAEVNLLGVAGLPLGIELNGSTLRMKHLGRGLPFIDGLTARKKAAVELVLTVPRAMKFEFGGLSSDLVLSGLSGSVEASTVGGKITLDDCRGATKLNAVGGEISAIGQSGALEVNTVTGNVTVAGNLDTVKLNSVSAGARLNLKGTQRLIQINTASGDIAMRIARQPLSYRINAKNGAVIDGTLHRESRKTVEFSIPGAGPGQVEINTGLGHTTIIHPEP